MKTIKLAGLMIAKGQSNRLPEKNKKEFKGKPMFLWNLEKMLGIFDVVYVSSEDKSIRNKAFLVGAIPIERGEELCGEVPDIPVYQHAFTNMENVDGIVAVHANNPNIERNLIVIVKKMLEMGVPEVMTCYPITRGKEYKKQHVNINGSIRGILRERLENYPDPYKPSPEVWVVDNSIEIETQDDFDQALIE